ncbi:MAG: restriction endonuclease [Lachnospiraceae bacterium]|nr:restriction endonuclease [Lachnospiraceae bacterium]
MKAGASLESYTQYVYSRLLELNDYDGVIVSKNVTIKGKSGATNEFDVFYQFTHLNIECKVAIECKDWKSAVPVGQVRDFASKIEDVGMGQFLGVMVSKNGYQEGAETYAHSKGITLLTEKQLPSIPQLLAGIIQKAFLPNRNTIGQPFWTLMEVSNGETTGTYYAPDLTVPLFYSKTIASKMLCNLPDAERFEVRGVSQYQLKGFIAQMKNFGVSAAIYCLPYWVKDIKEVPFISISAEQLENEYIY